MKPFWFFRFSATSSVLKATSLGVEVGEEHDHADEEQQVERLPRPEIGQERRH
jgi:hypothetical protein